MAGKRITFKQRVIIQKYIEDSSTKSLSDISKATKLTRNTIYNEIKKRRFLYSNKQRKYMKSVPLPCGLLNRFPFCCNSCPKKDRCAKDVYVYDAYIAEEDFQVQKHTCNEGPNLTRKQLDELDRKVSPRIFCNQSLYHICQSDETITVCEQTLRRYIKKGYLKAKPLDLPRTVQRKPPISHKKEKIHVPVDILCGRMYDDYTIFKAQYPDSFVIQIDLVIGKRSDKYAILTVFEPLSRLQFGIKVARTTTSVNNAIMKIFNELKRFNCKTFDVILTDNGIEFKDLPKLELSDDGIINFKVFYCNPYASYQKGGCERNHEFFRYVIKKGISLDTISQDEINKIFSNINSLKRNTLKGDNPYNEFSKEYGLKALEVFGLIKISPENIILK